MGTRCAPSPAHGSYHLSGGYLLFYSNTNRGKVSIDGLVAPWMGNHHEIAQHVVFPHLVHRSVARGVHFGAFGSSKIYAPVKLRASREGVFAPSIQGGDPRLIYGEPEEYSQEIGSLHGGKLFSREEIHGVRSAVPHHDERLGFLPVRYPRGKHHALQVAARRVVEKKTFLAGDEDEGLGAERRFLRSPVQGCKSVIAHSQPRIEGEQVIRGPFRVLEDIHRRENYLALDLGK